MGTVTTSVSPSPPSTCSSFSFKRKKSSSLPTKTKTKTKPNPNRFKKPRESIESKNPPKTSSSTSINGLNSPKLREDNEHAWSIPLHKKNPHAICKDIQRFARRNQLKEALTVLDYLDQLGIPVNVTTFSHLIAACIRAKSLVQAKQIHAHIRIHGLENNEFLKPKIGLMYASCGSGEEAKRVLFDDGDDGRCDSIYAWNALLRGNVVSGGRKYIDLLHDFSRMREIGVELNEYSYSCMIKSFGGAVAFRQGLKMHALLIKNGFIQSSMLKTSLMDVYFKCGRTRLACQLFDEIPERDVVLWGAMIAGLAHNKLQKEAINYMRWMIKEGVVPNSVVLSIILPVIGEVGAWKLGREIHAYVFKKGKYSEQPYVKSALIDMYCKCGDMTSGRKVFYSSKNRSAVSWTALMSGYISNGRLEQALRSIMWMQQEGFKPDVVSLATVLPACAELRALRQGREIHGYLVKNGFLPYVPLTTSLIVMYSKCGILELSRRLFDNMETRNVVVWTAFINSCAENGHPYEALDVFRSMQLSEHRADSVAISRVLGICSQLRLMKLGKEVHGQVLKKDIERTPFITGALVKMYGRCGGIQKAKLVFDMYPSLGVVPLTAMIEAYGYNNYCREALVLFDQLLDDGLVPNPTTFNVVLTICDQAGFADEACRICQLLTKKYGIRASKEHYSTIARLLSRLGSLWNAVRSSVYVYQLR
ncbi:hypothetical protein Cgig2_029618 [Carnegiea gigantea]|uniref:Pentatricopeptide repeat-containing protein n=1 Tax=Carnegiea gigantea TaxID=171969 RepID=A0A9Q1QIE3_9CARY|nr:hypothetical protein Cgig2_029618 [Carnegiea gigantea]